METLKKVEEKNYGKNLENFEEEKMNNFKKLGGKWMMTKRDKQTNKRNISII